MVSVVVVVRGRCTVRPSCVHVRTTRRCVWVVIRRKQRLRSRVVRPWWRREKRSRIGKSFGKLRKALRSVWNFGGRCVLYIIVEFDFVLILVAFSCCSMEKLADSENTNTDGLASNSSPNESVTSSSSAKVRKASSLRSLFSRRASQSDAPSAVAAKPQL